MVGFTGWTWRGVIALVFALGSLTGCGGGAGTRQADLLPDGDGWLPPVSVVVTHLGSWDVTLVSRGDELASATLYFNNGAAESYELSGLLDEAHSDNPGKLSYLKAETKGGDYWYFDRSGLWLPRGYFPKFQSTVMGKGKTPSGVWVDNNYISVSSSDTYSEVKVGYNDGSMQAFDTSAMGGMYELHLPGENVEAVRITLQADGSKWYFDNAGNELPLESKWYADMD
jgi:hypothetical protein